MAAAQFQGHFGNIHLFGVVQPPHPHVNAQMATKRHHATMWNQVPATAAATLRVTNVPGMPVPNPAALGLPHDPINDYEWLIQHRIGHSYVNPGLHVLPHSTGAIMAMQEGELPPGGGTMPSVSVGQAPFIRVNAGNAPVVPVATNLPAGVAAGATLYFVFRITTLYFRNGNTRATVLAAAQGGGVGWNTRYAGNPDVVAANNYNQDSMLMADHVRSLPALNPLARAVDRTIRMTVVCGANGYFTPAALQEAVEGALFNAELAGHVTYTVAGNAGVDLYNPFTMVHANPRWGAQLVGCRVRDGGVGGGVCWLEALLCRLINRCNVEQPTRASLISKMRSVIATRSGWATAREWDPLSEGVTPADLIALAETFPSLHCSVTVMTINNMSVARYITKSHRAVSIFLLMLSPTHVILKDYRQAPPGMDSLTWVGPGRPPFVPESETLLFFTSAEDLIQKIDALPALPLPGAAAADDDPDAGARLCLPVVRCVSSDLLDPVTHLGSLLIHLCQSSAAAGKTRLIEHLGFPPTAQLCDVLGPTMINSVGGRVIRLDTQYHDKEHLRHQLATYHDSAHEFELAPCVVVNDHRGRTPVFVDVLMATVGAFRTDTFGPHLRELIKHSPIGGLFCTDSAIDPATANLVEIDQVKAYSEALRNEGSRFGGHAWPIFGLADEFVYFNGLQEWAFPYLFQYDPSAPPPVPATARLPVGLYLVPGPQKMSCGAVLDFTLYPAPLLEYMLAHGTTTIHSVQAVCIPSYRLAPGAFRAGIDKLRLLVGPRQARDIVNFTVGSWGRTTRVSSRTSVTDSKEMAFGMAQHMNSISDEISCHVASLSTLYGDPSVPPLPDDAPGDSYLLTQQVVADVTHNNWSLRHMVVGLTTLATLQLRRLLLDCGATLVGAWGDGVVLHATDPALPALLAKFAAEGDACLYSIKTDVVGLERFRHASGGRDPDASQLKRAGFVITDLDRAARIAENALPPADFQTQAIDGSLLGGMVLGPAGSGKSYMMTHVVNAINAHAPDTAIALTETAQLVRKFQLADVNTQTFAHMLTLYSKAPMIFWQRASKLTLVWVDEMFRMTLPVVEMLHAMKFRNPSLRLFFSGDAHQSFGFEDIPGGAFSNSSVTDWSRRHITQHLAHFNVITLPVHPDSSRFKTESDAAAMKQMRDHGTIDFTKFNYSVDPIPGVYTLTWRASTAAALNKNGMRDFARAHCSTLDEYANPCLDPSRCLFDADGDVSHCDGLPVRSFSSFKRAAASDAEDDADAEDGDGAVCILNGERGTLHVSGELVHFAAKDTGELSLLTVAEAQSFLDPDFACTSYRVQGETFLESEPYQVVETAAGFRAMYTAISRAETCGQVTVVGPESIKSKKWSFVEKTGVDAMREDAGIERQRVQTPTQTWVGSVTLLAQDVADDPESVAAVLTVIGSREHVTQQLATLVDLVFTEQCPPVIALSDAARAELRLIGADNFVAGPRSLYAVPNRRRGMTHAWENIEALRAAFRDRGLVDAEVLNDAAPPVWSYDGGGGRGCGRVWSPDAACLEEITPDYVSVPASPTRLARRQLGSSVTATHMRVRNGVAENWARITVKSPTVGGEADAGELGRAVKQVVVRDVAEGPSVAWNAILRAVTEARLADAKCHIDRPLINGKGGHAQFQADTLAVARGAFAHVFSRDQWPGTWDEWQLFTTEA